MTYSALKELNEIVIMLLDEERVFVADRVPQDGQMSSQHYTHLSLLFAAYSFSLLFFVFCLFVCLMFLLFGFYFVRFFLADLE